MYDYQQIMQHISEIERRLGYVFCDKNLLALSFVHRSYLNENRGAIAAHNERLEFLGDSVLGVLVAEYLYRTLPTQPEGDLSRLRSRLVDAHSCYIYISRLDLGEFLLLGKGERMNDGRGRETILANLFESLIGAIYLDGGIEAARHFLFESCSQTMQSIIEGPLRNWKAELQDYAQKRYQETPTYTVVSEVGPDHSKVFHVSVVVNQVEVGRGTGASKKEAQQAAAAHALQQLESDHKL